MERKKNPKLDETMENKNLELLKAALGCLLPTDEAEATLAKLTHHLGRFSTIMRTSEEGLAAVPGVSPEVARYLSITLELARAALRTPPAEHADSMLYADYRTLLFGELFGKKEETVSLVLADNHFRRLYSGAVLQGSISEAAMNISLIISLCMKYHASFAILAHNHPTGIALPSVEDVVATSQVAMSLVGIDVVLRDHIIFTDTEEFSFAKNGLLKELMELAAKNRAAGLEWARRIGRFGFTENRFSLRDEEE